MPEIAATTLGSVLGARDGGVLRFRAVPYAAPPVGALRFAPPQAAEPWSGVRDATRPGPIAPQPSSRLRLAMGDFVREQSEDCLTLHIVTPKADAAARPVIVWLHGGAYLSGAGSLDWYDGGPLAQAGDVVVVGVNHRLGPLGFLHYPGLADGMMGLRDIVAALHFIRDNIAAFGGDPDNVTLMGQSAGGGAILRLLTMDTAGLFHRVIVQSGPVRRGLAAAEATSRAVRMMRLLDIDPEAPDAAEQLRAAPFDRLITLQMTIARENARFAEADPAFPPVFDDFGSTEIFTDRIAQAAAERGIDVMVGTTREEMHAFFVPSPDMAAPDPAAVAERFATLAGSADAIETYRLRRPGGSVRDLLSDLVTDHRFLFPLLRLAERIAATGRPVFAYQFDWGAPGSPWEACHCIELPFVFGTRAAWGDAPMLQGMDEAEYAGLSATMMAAWTRFARTGNPALPGLPWPRYESGRRETMRLGRLVGAVGDLAGMSARG